MTHGIYTRDFFIFPTIVIHNCDGIYFTVELAWLKWYVGVIKNCIDVKGGIESD